MRIDGEGWIDEAMQIPSPNQDERPQPVVISLVVIHAISLPPERFGGPAITSLFLNALDPAGHASYAAIGGLRVSSHVLIRRDGSIVQYVPFARRAWHAGVSSWRDRAACNDFSIGIELEGSDCQAFEGAQYRSLDELLRVIATVYPIVDVRGHSDVAPGRKTDPGPFFAWSEISWSVPVDGKTV